jgi:hypothetical protein
MKTADIKLELHSVIDNAPSGKLKDMYGLIVNYLNGSSVSEEWDVLPQNEQEKTLLSLQQSYKKQGNTLSEITARLKAKYDGK